MTNREFFSAIVAANINEDLTNHAKVEIEKLDTRNAKRANTPSKAQIENEPIKKLLVELFDSAELILTASDCAARVEISTQKASALLRQLVDEGRLSKLEVKVPKKGKQVGYTLPKGV